MHVKTTTGHGGQIAYSILEGIKKSINLENRKK